MTLAKRKSKSRSRIRKRIKMRSKKRSKTGPQSGAPSHTTKPIGVAEYRIGQPLPPALREALPSQEQLRAELEKTADGRERASDGVPTPPRRRMRRP